ncbi:MAG: hypothetical protein RIA69_09800 [Cyclobacteriaceae bacterium]
MSNIVHIGFPKTATTFLQKEVFPHLHNSNYVDYRKCEGIFNDLIYLDDLDYDEAPIKKKLDTFMGSGDNLFSFEALVGAPFIYKGLGRSNIPARLKSLGFDKVIITLRDQVTMYDSLYRQYVIQGGVVRFKDFIDKDKKWNLYRRSFNPDYLCYDKLILLYMEVFGKQNILVLKHESLQQDKTNYLGQIEAFIGDKLADTSSNKKVNSSLCNLSIALLRIVNHFIFTSQKPNNLISNHISTRNVSRIFMAILDPYLFQFFSSRKSFVDEKTTQYIRAYYAKSNAATDRLLKNDT